MGRREDGDGEAREDSVPLTQQGKLGLGPRVRWSLGPRVWWSPGPLGSGGFGSAAVRARKARTEGAWYLLVQRVPGAAWSRTGPGRRGRPLAAAALQEVHARRAAALLALEVEEHILVEGEPLLVPAARFGCLLAQEAALGALLAGQQGQVQGVPLVVAHAFLHGEGTGEGGSPLPRNHRPAGSPQGSLAGVLVGKGRPLSRRCAQGTPAGLRGAAPRGSEGRWAASGHVLRRYRRPPGRAKSREPPTFTRRVAP